jgi:hypothetical protein
MENDITYVLTVRYNYDLNNASYRYNNQKWKDNYSYMISTKK